MTVLFLCSVLFLHLVSHVTLRSVGQGSYIVHLDSAQPTAYYWHIYNSVYGCSHLGHLVAAPTTRPSESAQDPRLVPQCLMGRRGGNSCKRDRGLREEARVRRTGKSCTRQN